MIVNTQLAKSAGCQNKDKWATPQKLFDQLNDRYGFTLDPCCEIHTAKCTKFYTEEQNGLTKDWSGEVVFCNPPYSRDRIKIWMKKCAEEAAKGVKIVALIPVSSSSKWWHEFVWNNARIEFLKGRIRFDGAPHTAPFSSCLAIWNF